MPIMAASSSEYDAHLASDKMETKDSVLVCGTSGSITCPFVTIAKPWWVVFPPAMLKPLAYSLNL